MSAFEPVIGVEIHVQLSTRTKMFCGCELSFGDPPNTHTCPVCLAHPGVLPVVNEEAVRRAVLIGLALGCEIAPESIFHRKNYFYPDLPKAYQVSQFDIPICGRGEFVALREDGSELRVGITRAHLEEDAAKLTHAGGRRAGAEQSVVDFNRGGTPLVEIVTEPDLRSASDVATFLRQLRQTLLFLGVSDCSMEEGSMRADANVSIRPVGSHELGTKTELKNMNSFRFLERGIEAEIARQEQILSDGGRVSQETVHYEPETGHITSLRSKEESHDYRYFPEPDLVPVAPDPAWVDGLRQGLPELPVPLRRRMVAEMGLSDEDAAVLTESPQLVAYFMEAAAQADPKACANWIRGELRAQLRETGTEPWESKVTPAHVAGLVDLLAAGTIAVPAAKEVLAGMIETGEQPARVVEARGLGAMDESELAGIVAELVAANPDQAQQLRDGKDKVLGFFVGQAMKRTGGRANPQAVQQLVRDAVAG